MITFSFTEPTTFDLVGDMRLILAWLRGGYRLFAHRLAGRLETWMDAPSPKALKLKPADVAGLLDRDLIEEDAAASTDAVSVYRLTAAGRKAAA